MAAESNSIIVTPSSERIMRGSTFDVTVSVQNASELSSLAFEIKYDPDLLEVQGTPTLKTSVLEFLMENNDSGFWYFPLTVADGDKTLSAGTNELVKMTFKVKSDAPESATSAQIKAVFDEGSQYYLSPNGQKTNLVTQDATVEFVKTVNISAIDGVNPPVAGQTPVTSIIETDQFTGSVSWSGNPTKFEYDTAYTATITLTPKSGFTLDGVSANFFKVSGATATNSADNGVITATFPSTGKQTPDIKNIVIKAPAANEIPETFIPENAQYSGAIAWSPEITGKFGYYEVYQATITLAAKGTYTVDELPSDFFTVNGQPATYDSQTHTVTVNFDRTAEQPISIKEIEGIIPPAFGQIPVTSIKETDQFTGTVSWEPNDTTFAYDTQYTAKITLTPKAGFTVDGVGEDWFSVGYAEATNLANSNEITAIFDKTLPEPAVDDENITMFEILGIDAPAIGETPDTTIEECDEYFGSVVWTPNDVPFRANTHYTAKFTRTPKKGYTFANVPANAFSVAGSQAKNDAGSNFVSVTFEEIPGDKTVDINEISGLVVPVTGATPITEITETEQFTGTVSWTPNDQIFVYNTEYTATVTLVAKEDWTFDGIPKDFFFVSGAKSAVNDANTGNTGIVTVTFNATTAQTVDISAITGIIPPKKGNNPVKGVVDQQDNNQYKVSVSWSGNPDTFAAATEYIATIAITANEGFTLDGLAETFFTVEGATAVTYKNGVIEAVFPATESESNYILGDVNGDDVFSPLDILRLQRYYAKWSVPNPHLCVERGDVTGDGEVTPLDILRMQRVYAKWPGVVLE
ncbi:MAG: dockerin type I domain-containing protein [Clostridiales bacterium]|nr:dockerin type I domain-containing protein [Clostridiales bacterium]